MPTFNGCMIKRDVIRLICSDERSKFWLKGIEHRLSEKTNRNLLICPFDEVPWPVKFFVYFPYTKEENGRLLRMLNLCNPKLANIDWDVLHRKVTDNGIQLLVTVDESTAEAIEGENGQLYFGAGKAILRRVEKKKATQQSEMIKKLIKMLIKIATPRT